MSAGKPVAGEPVTVRAAGAVLWRPAHLPDSGVTVAVVHRPKFGDWSLPKGKLEPGETAPAAAARETWEETGSRPILGRPLGDISYHVQRPAPGRKVVSYFAARADDSPFLPNHEVDELRWLPPAEAVGLLSYDNDRTILDRFTALPAKLRTVLLVRHAKAGHRSNWHGPDGERPLSPAGEEQAKALRAMLPLFGPTRVHAVDRTRCVRTVQGLADDLGVPLRIEPLLGEESFRRDPDPAVERMARLVEGDGVPVVCSQGGAIPGLIRGLAARSGLKPGDVVPCKKGSTWVLSFDGNLLLAADYLATALPKPSPS
ncbi:MAG TPA: NUDIX hydrolase [Pseudonocardiaceae bacterium]|jgi:8-oxo-dGTP diphosphatase|nr:NUDIX hydrolase [Pseudonocardiaceae bacterium]